MSLSYEERLSDSPYVETVTHGYTMTAGGAIRPAETHWHLVVVRHQGKTLPLIVGPLTTAGAVSWGADAEILWVKFKLGTFMPHLPTHNSLDRETPLSDATGRSFWLKGSTWNIPDFENVETFIDRLVDQEILVRDHLVDAALQGHPPTISDRTLRHRFLRATGLRHGHILQVERAQRAATLLRQGHSISDTVYEAGYFDQSHLTRSLKQWVGFTPSQILRRDSPE